MTALRPPTWCPTCPPEPDLEETALLVRLDPDPAPAPAVRTREGAR
jgi:hypothetical protein